MTAVVHGNAAGLTGVRVTEVPSPRPGPGEVVVALRAAGLNHRDLFLVGARGPGDAPVVLGSDGAGVVVAAGPGAAVEPGTEVVVNPSLDWDEPGGVPEVPAILGVPTDGTFAEYVVVPAKNVAPKPAHLGWSEAAALPLAALTAYRALFTRGGLRAGDHVLLPGIGSGVATFALAMAKAAGATVSVTSRSPEKCRRARELGADRAVGSGEDWRTALAEPVDLVVDSVGSATFGQCLSVLRPGGRLVSLGATTGAEVSLSLREMFFRQISVLGTSMGSAREFSQMLALVAEHEIRPVVHRTYSLDDGPRALADLAAGDQFGKLVLTVD
ncbi:putative zinc-type alcohol dehydrogenase-like protein YogA [Amycolatopsis deserti]|uniref:Zinc-type alcohol dehydrogenase-like protein YogA n=1 Tax=Amycolatopsis deserti TaxID=185696 RepID=A0ABQ3IUX2_9PSEU|nr:zinc-binding dehydrogenase [Amycolatopsis deserti]GHE89856.1 putative zinc-type alcohol dehydrogenase-like protein YogA [Amycolatopsis deserti]